MVLICLGMSLSEFAHTIFASFWVGQIQLTSFCQMPRKINLLIYTDLGNFIYTPPQKNPVTPLCCKYQTNKRKLCSIASKFELHCT